MELQALDWAIIVGYFAIALGIGLWFRRRAGSSFVEYFASGRSLPWWIAGTSMVATTFAADTPLWVTGKVAAHGLAGNWLWWSWAFGGMLTVFVFAKLWRRAEVLTDVELIELRYAGRAAAFLRGFRGFYVAVVMNSIVIGWVTKAMASVLQQTVLFDAAASTSVVATSHADLWLIAIMLAATGAYSVVSGLWGVAVTDMLQFVLAMVGCTALAVIAVDHVGGTAELHSRVTANVGSDQAFGFFPDFAATDPWMPIGVFLALVLSQWWATWYPGAEPGGGGYVVQRMASCKDERHAVKATLLFQLAHYCIRPWPWIMVAFAALAMHPELRTWATAPAGSNLPNPEGAYPLLIRELAPVGLRGLMLVTFAAAYMSTVSTQMNWGASYLVNDLYKRFLRPGAGERELLRASRGASALVLLLGGGVSWYMLAGGVSIDDAWQFLCALGGGVGAVFLLRWFWWRINVWSEIVAMTGSLVVFAVVKAWQRGAAPGEGLADGYTSLVVASTTILLWLAATLLTRPEPQAHLVAFYRKVRPDGPGWGPVAAAAPDVRRDGTLRRGLLCAVLGSIVIWLCLPGIGAVIFGDVGKAVLCLGGAAVAGALLLRLGPRATTTAAGAE
ncbi:MAG: Na+:solute symporter [Planctomycetes bacterium]|nr:Na+:solute symporter [Planctomycetota bacterium]